MGLKNFLFCSHGNHWINEQRSLYLANLRLSLNSQGQVYSIAKMFHIQGLSLMRIIHPFSRQLSIFMIHSEVVRYQLHVVANSGDLINLTVDLHRSLGFLSVPTDCLRSYQCLLRLISLPQSTCGFCSFFSLGSSLCDLHYEYVAELMMIFFFRIFLSR